MIVDQWSINLYWRDESREWGGRGRIIDDAQRRGGAGVARSGGRGDSHQDKDERLKHRTLAPWVWGWREWAERVASELSSHPWRPFRLLPFPERLCLSPEVFQVLSSSSLGPTLALPSVQVLGNSKGVGVPAQNYVFWGFCFPFGKNNQEEKIYSRWDKAPSLRVAVSLKLTIGMESLFDV